MVKTFFGGLLCKYAAVIGKPQSTYMCTMGILKRIHNYRIGPVVIILEVILQKHVSNMKLLIFWQTAFIIYKSPMMGPGVCLSYILVLSGIYFDNNTTVM